MAGRVLAGNYRYVEVPKGDGPAVRHKYGPGTPEKDLPKDAVEELEEAGMLVREDRFDSDTGVVLSNADYVARLEAEASGEDEDEDDGDEPPTSKAPANQK